MRAPRASARLGGLPGWWDLGVKHCPFVLGHGTVLGLVLVQEAASGIEPETVHSGIPSV